MTILAVLSGIDILTTFVAYIQGLFS